MVKHIGTTQIVFPIKTANNLKTSMTAKTHEGEGEGEGGRRSVGGRTVQIRVRDNKKGSAGESKTVTEKKKGLEAFYAQKAEGRAQHRGKLVVHRRSRFCFRQAKKNKSKQHGKWKGRRGR